MFGTGVIVTVAFVHMLSPADKLLSGEDAPEFFKEKYDAFSGVFAVIGLILAHAIQVIVKEYFNEHNKNGVYNTIDGEKKNFFFFVDKYIYNKKNINNYFIYINI